MDGRSEQGPAELLARLCVCVPGGCGLDRGAAVSCPESTVRVCRLVMCVQGAVLGVDPCVGHAWAIYVLAFESM